MLLPGHCIALALSFYYVKRHFHFRSDAWASRESVVADRDEYVEGAIAVQPLMRELPGIFTLIHLQLKTFFAVYFS